MFFNRAAEEDSRAPGQSQRLLAYTLFDSIELWVPRAMGPLSLTHLTPLSLALWVAQWLVVRGEPRA